MEVEQILMKSIKTIQFGIMIKGFSMNFILTLIIIMSPLLSWDWPWADYTFEKRGVEITFPGEYKQNPEIGNLSLGVDGFSESYTFEETYGIFGINFISSQREIESSLEQLMYAGIRSANGTLHDKSLYSIDGYPTLGYIYYIDYTSQGGPVVFTMEQCFRLDSYTVVVTKFVGTQNSILREEVKNFFDSLSIK